MLCLFSIESVWLTCFSAVADVPTVAPSDNTSSTILTLGFGLMGIIDLWQTLAKWLLIPQFLQVFSRAGQFRQWLVDQV